MITAGPGRVGHKCDKCGSICLKAEKPTKIIYFEFPNVYREELYWELCDKCVVWTKTLDDLAFYQVKR
jgi:hypothetical protein